MNWNPFKKKPVSTPTGTQPGSPARLPAEISRDIAERRAEEIAVLRRKKLIEEVRKEIADAAASGYTSVGIPRSRLLHKQENAYLRDLLIADGYEVTVVDERDSFYPVTISW